MDKGVLILNALLIHFIMELTVFVQIQKIYASLGNTLMEKIVFILKINVLKELNGMEPFVYLIFKDAQLAFINLMGYVLLFLNLAFLQVFGKMENAK